MITYKDWSNLLLLVSFCLPSSLWAFNYRLNKESILVGESAVLSITFPENRSEGNPIVLDELLNQHPKLKVLERNTSRTDSTLTMTFEITAYEAGDYRVPPIQFQWASDTFSTEALALKVTTTRAPQDLELRPDFGTLKPPFPWRKAYVWFIATLGALLALWVVRWSVQRIPWRHWKRLSFTLRWPSVETDRMWLKKEIRRFREELKKGKVSPEIVDQIFYTLAVFLKRRTHFPVPSLTTKELITELPQQSNQTQFEAFLTKKDQFKYQLTNKSQALEVAEDLLSQIERQFL